MNVLYVVPYVPNLIRVRPYNLIRRLTDRGHRITVVTQYTGESEYADVLALRSHCERVVAFPLSRLRSLWNCIVAMPGDEPLQFSYCWQPALADELRTLRAQDAFDVMHVEHLRGARYGLELTRQANGSNGNGHHPPVVWDSVDCISLLFGRTASKSKRRSSQMIAKLEKGRTERLEAWLPLQFDHVLLTSAADRAALAELSPSASDTISVLGHGVDVDYFAPNDEIVREPATIVLSGKMSYHANVSMALRFVHEIMPLVWAKRPEAKVVVVGKDPVHEIRALAGNPAVTVTGTVNDIRPYLQRATVAAVPLPYGAGVQNKVLEAMACATPVIASPQAVAALSIDPGRELIVADSAEDFARAVLSVLDDKAAQRSLGEAGRAYVERNHDWNNIAAYLEEIYHGVIAQEFQPG